MKKCSNCPDDIGEKSYSSKEIPGEYCSCDCYIDALMKMLGHTGLVGKFEICPDGHGGVFLK